MSELATKLREILVDMGAVLVGYGDVSDIVDGETKTGVAIAIPMERDMIRGIEEHVTMDYAQWYKDTNAKLDAAIKAGGEYLRSCGYKTRELTMDNVVRDANNCTELPLKSVAIRAGLGWIGKSAVLVTPQYGGAIRMSALLTDAPLPLNEPILESKCGGCTKCKDICPANAITGKTWVKGIERAELVDQAACAATAMANCRAAIGLDMTICGKCFVYCPYTRKYIEG